MGVWHQKQLALFSPPIDPRQLVRQAAAGDSSIALLTANDIPYYRFSYLLERPKGMVSTVIQLGSTLFCIRLLLAVFSLP